MGQFNISLSSQLTSLFVAIIITLCAVNPARAVIEESGNTGPNAGGTVVLAKRFVSGNNSDEIAAVKFLRLHDRLASEQCNGAVQAEWNYATNITQQNKEKLVSFFFGGNWFVCIKQTCECDLYVNPSGNRQ